MRGHGRVEFQTPGHGTAAAVPTWQASSNERSSALAPAHAIWLVRALDREGNRAALVALYGLATGSDPHAPNRIQPAKLVAGIITALDSGRLLLLPGDAHGQSAMGATGASSDTGSAEQRLVSAVVTGWPSLSFEGTRYVLLAAGGGTLVSGFTDFGQVPASEADKLVARMGEVLSRTAADRSLWADVRAAVSRGDDKARIVVLRPLQGATAPAPEAVAAPKPPARPMIAKRTWIEFKIQFDDGAPYPGNCVIEVPGGIKSEGPPDGEGVIRIDRIDPGSVKIAFPDLDFTA
jgi:hypothetical protein